MLHPKFDPKLDLKLERVVDVPREKIWKAWTQPEHLKKWFTPAPWSTVEARVDLRPGGEFFTVMRSPEGQDYPNEGCYLEIIPNEKVVWTDALSAGFRPTGKGYLTEQADQMGPFTAVIVLEAVDANTTRYTAYGLHRQESDRKKHEEMGFHDGWGTVLTQMVDLIKAGTN